MTRTRFDNAHHMPPSLLRLSRSRDSDVAGFAGQRNVREIDMRHQQLGDFGTCIQASENLHIRHDGKVVVRPILSFWMCGFNDSICFDGDNRALAEPGMDWHA